MKITDFEANIYFLELNTIKNQPGLDFALWYRIDKLQGKFSKAFESVQGLIKKINEDIPEIESNSLRYKLIEILGDTGKEYSLEKIPMNLLEGIKGNWSVLRALIEIPIEEENKEVIEN